MKEVVCQKDHPCESPLYGHIRYLDQELRQTHHPSTSSTCQYFKLRFVSLRQIQAHILILYHLHKSMQMHILYKSYLPPSRLSPQLDFDTRNALALLKRKHQLYTSSRMPERSPNRVETPCLRMARRSRRRMFLTVGDQSADLALVRSITLPSPTENLDRLIKHVSRLSFIFELHYFHLYELPGVYSSNFVYFI